MNVSLSKFIHLIAGQNSYFTYYNRLFEDVKMQINEFITMTMQQIIIIIIMQVLAIVYQSIGNIPELSQNQPAGNPFTRLPNTDTWLNSL